MPVGRVGVVGGGVAGALLAWRVRQASRRITVDVYTGSTEADATGASGGMVRGFERSVEHSQLAAESLAELRGDPVLRESARYREIGSVYLLPPGTDPTGSVRVVEELLPGSATVLTGGELLAGYPFRRLPAGATAVVERCAGYLSPARLRAAALDWLADGGATIRPVPVVGLDPEPALRLADGTTRSYDAVVLATGPWTRTLLEANGFATGGLCTRQIQYAVYSGQIAGLGAFVDDGTGLYGRPADDGEFLLGLPCDRWDVDPVKVRPDHRLAGRVARQARARLAFPAPGQRPVRTIVSCDCYHDPPGLLLRQTTGTATVFTFTGGSGGAAKSVLAASREAASALLR